MGASSLNLEPGPGRTWVVPALLIPLLLLAWLSLSPPLTPAAERVFHGNVKSRKFHSPDCRYYNCKNCVVKFATREKALAAGYVPCKVCKP